MSHRNHGMVRLDDQTQCQKCFITLTEDNICPNQGYICRSCFGSTRKPGRPFGACDKKKRKTRIYPKRNAEPSETEGDCDMLEVVEVFFPNKKDDLYFMANSRIPNELKVGRSMDPARRARELARSQNFRMEILKTYPCQGFLEATVHKRLHARRVSEGDGQEWFQVDVDTADMIVQGAIAESQL